MDGDNKVFVFDRKEIVLIFVFMVLIAATAFTLGVRVGKGLSLKKAGYTESDIERVTLRSNKEEDVDEIMSDEDTKITPESLEKLSLEKVDQNLQDAKSAPVKNNIGEDDYSPALDTDIPLPSDLMPKSQTEIKEETPDSINITQEGSGDRYSGKYTVQIGSFDMLDDAKEFAETFLLRGYDVIIRQVELRERGTYFRVSLGVFKSAQDAESFINQERTLFSDQDKIIKRFE